MGRPFFVPGRLRENRIKQTYRAGVRSGSASGSARERLRSMRVTVPATALAQAIRNPRPPDTALPPDPAGRHRPDGVERARRDGCQIVAGEDRRGGYRGRPCRDLRSKSGAGRRYSVQFDRSFRKTTGESLILKSSQTSVCGERTGTAQIRISEDRKAERRVPQISVAKIRRLKIHSDQVCLMQTCAVKIHAARSIPRQISPFYPLKGSMPLRSGTLRKLQR